jgi:predicted phosphodiesterase
MIEVTKKIPVLLLLLCLVSCNAFDYSPYDGRVTGETGINEKNIALIAKQCAGKDTIRFAMISDTQRWYDETRIFVTKLNERNDIDFVFHGGDLTDFGATKEFLWQRDILNKLKVPYVVLLGNHDCLGDGEDVFKKVYGEPNFSFWASNIKFVCINTNALEFDYSNPIPDFNYIESQLDTIPSADEKTIFAMHARPYSEQFDNNVAKVLEYEIRRFPQLQFCLSAHDHRVEADNLFGDGVMYYASANIADRTYLVFTLYKGGYKYEVVEF